MGMYDRPWYREAPRARMGAGFRRLVMVRGLIIANVICFLLQSRQVLNAFMLFPKDVVEQLRIWQLVTSMFLHGSVGHLLMNMFVLWMFGPAVERRLGPRVFLRFYFGGGLLAGIAYVLIGYLTGDLRPSLGASGAIMGVLVYYTFLAPNQIVYLFLFIPMKMLHATLLFIGLDLYYFVFSGAGETGVAHTAHLGGALFGFL